MKQQLYNIYFPDSLSELNSMHIMHFDNKLMSFLISIFLNFFDGKYLMSLLIIEIQKAIIFSLVFVANKVINLLKSDFLARYFFVSNESLAILSTHQSAISLISSKL